MPRVSGSTAAKSRPLSLILRTLAITCPPRDGASGNSLGLGE
jgi:hypothetical protein